MIGSETPGVGAWERAHSRECRGLSDDVIAKQERQPKNGVDLNSLWENKARRSYFNFMLEQTRAGVVRGAECWLWM